MTPEERSFWERVRDRRFAGVKWRRQHPVGPFHADFYCADWRVVIELDGPVHDGCEERDVGRDIYFRSLGLRVLRLKNEVWNESRELVLAWLAETFRVRRTSRIRAPDA